MGRIQKRAATIVKRRAWRYDYGVDQAHSNWHLSCLAGGRMVTWEPAFSRMIWIDQNTSRVLHFEMAARNLPDILKCSRNVTDFQNYKEYVADTNISFGDGR